MVIPLLSGQRSKDVVRDGGQGRKRKQTQVYNHPYANGSCPSWQMKSDKPYQAYNDVYPKSVNGNGSWNRVQSPQGGQQLVPLRRPIPQSSHGTYGYRSSQHLPMRPATAAPTACPITRGLNQGAVLLDQVAARLNDVISRLDGTECNEEDVNSMLNQMNIGGRSEGRNRSLPAISEQSASQQKARSGLINFEKTWSYANSRLPPCLPPLTVYMPTWRLLCMAARASEDAYKRPHGAEQEDHIDANWRHGTKAMIVKSRPVDDQNLIVIAIRGSQKNFVDWAVNFRPAPTAPIGFLDDQGNACHAGFLSVARAMVAPIAARLRSLLEQDPGRASSSLLLTGHSAGGAVAALLFMHMMSKTMETELNILTGCFKRVHCVTFGAPPVALLPLQKPMDKALERNIFISFANEGDPVVRADKAYILSLAKLIAAPAPGSNNVPPSHQVNTHPTEPHRLVNKLSLQKLQSKSASNLAAGNHSSATVPAPYWPVPPATLSNAGRLILLRERPGRQRRRRAEAVYISDDQLRAVMFGDPQMHLMAQYRRRIDALAVAAVTGPP